jgi:lysozyme family protein
MTFDEAFHRLLGHEGGYVNHPADPGGETNWGISKRQFPDLDIKALTVDEAKGIYRRGYWNQVRADDLPAQLRFDVVDLAVNSGVETAVRFLQQALEVADDGRLGPVTLAAARAQHPYLTLLRLNGLRLRHMTRLSTWQTFGRGWANRVASNLTGV